MNDRLLDVDDLVVEYPGRGFRAQALPGAARASRWTSCPRETVGPGRRVRARARPRSAGPSSASHPSPAGTIGFDGRDISHLPKSERRALSSDIGVVFQDPYTSLNPAMTIQQILTEPLTVAKVPRAEAIQRVKELLDQVQLPGQRRRPPAPRVQRRPAPAGRDRPGARALDPS